MGNRSRSGANGSLGWPSTATISGVAPSTAIVIAARSPALARRRRTRAPGGAANHCGAGDAPAVTSDRGWPGVVPQAAGCVEPPIGENDDRLEIDGGRRGLLDDDRAEQTRCELARGRRADVGQIEVEAGVGRREANLGFAAGFDRRLGKAADSGERVDDSQAGKLSVVGASRRLARLSFSSSPISAGCSGPGTVPS